MSDVSTLLRQSIKCKCPRCGEGDLFKPGFFDLTLHAVCSYCQLDLAKNDSADGPAVFLIFILGFLIVPMALLLDHLYRVPLWAHVMLWGPLSLLLIFGMLKPVKAMVIALQWKHRGTHWGE